MQLLQDKNGKTYRARLQTNNLELIESVTGGLQIDDIFGDTDPLPQLLLRPRLMWKVVKALIGPQVEEMYAAAMDGAPDYTELFDQKEIWEWLEGLIADFHPPQNSERISQLFSDLKTGTEVVEKFQARQEESRKLERQMMAMFGSNPKVAEKLMNNPRALQALAGGSED